MLRLVQAADELGPVALLSAELTEWARERTLADYGVDLEFESEEGLFRDLDSMREYARGSTLPRSKVSPSAWAL